jgi:hypothetical protein
MLPLSNIFLLPGFHSEIYIHIEHAHAGLVFCETGKVFALFASAIDPVYEFRLRRRKII